jgi:hypothetical protein
VDNSALESLVARLEAAAAAPVRAPADQITKFRLQHWAAVAVVACVWLLMLGGSGGSAAAADAQHTNRCHLDELREGLSLARVPATDARARGLRDG